MMNRYQPGSITDPIVSPMIRRAHRSVSWPALAMLSGSAAAVTLSFKDGAPDCLYFSDAPNNCRELSQRVISAYQKNA